MCAGAGGTFEMGKRVEREIDFAGRAAEFVAPNAFEEIGGKFAGFEKFLEGEMRIHAGGDDVGKKLFAGLQDNARGAAMVHENFSDWRFGANLHACFASGIADGVRNGASAAAAETPGAECAVDFSHVVMEENVGGP